MLEYLKHETMDKWQNANLYQIDLLTPFKSTLPIVNAEHSLLVKNKKQFLAEHS